MELTPAKKRYIHAAAALLALSLLFPFILLLPVSAGDSSAASAGPEEGIYVIKNSGTGLCLDAYKYSSKPVGKAYAAAYSAKDSAQFFTLRKTENGTWYLIPGSENKKYLFSYSDGTAEGGLLRKIPISSADASCEFDITPLRSGLYTIAPAYGENLRAVLACSTETTVLGDISVQFADYSVTDPSQLWTLEAVETESLTVAWSHTRLKIYSSGKFYARKIPYDLNNTGISWESDNEDVLLVGEDGSYCALATGTANITASYMGVSAGFTVDVTDSDCFTWYSQNNMTGSNWDATNLGTLRFTGGGSKKRFAEDSKLDSGYTSWIEEGCALCSVAMVLHNLGATMKTGYDMRSGQDGNLPADPYTCALANAGIVGTKSPSETASGNPVYMRWEYVANRFQVDGEDVTYKKIYSPSRKLIKTLLEEHPCGVIVEFVRGLNTHFVVFSECINPEENTSSKLRFRVFDPSGYYPENGDGVELEDTVAYTALKYRYSSIYAVIVYDTESRIN